jgi:hypothetical protein
MNPIVRNNFLLGLTPRIGLTPWTRTPAAQVLSNFPGRGSGGRRPRSPAKHCLSLSPSRPSFVPRRPGNSEPHFRWLCRRTIKRTRRQLVVKRIPALTIAWRAKKPPQLRRTIAANTPTKRQTITTSVHAHERIMRNRPLTALSPPLAGTSDPMGGRALPYGVFILEHRGLLGFGFMGGGRKKVPAHPPLL